MVQKGKRGIEEIIGIGELKKSKSIGYQISAEFYGVKNIAYVKQLEPVLKEALKKSRLNVVKGEKPRFFQFKPHGVTGIVLLEESHIAFHSWPEYNYIAIDIFSCSGKKKAEIAYNVFKKRLKPKKIRKVQIYKVLQEY